MPGRHAVEDALALVGLPYKDKKLFAQYSMGMKQRLAIALAVMHDPELLILDEPINGLDPIGIAEMRRFIRQLCDERGKTILLSSHILSEVAQLADDIGIIDNGALLEEESLQALEEKNGRVHPSRRFGRRPGGADAGDRIRHRPFHGRETTAACAFSICRCSCRSWRTPYRKTAWR